MRTQNRNVTAMRIIVFGTQRGSSGARSRLASEASLWSGGLGNKFKSYPSAIVKFLLSMIVRWATSFEIAKCVTVK